eukprot:5668749-Prymnesium_polylepis.1
MTSLSHSQSGCAAGALPGAIFYTSCTAEQLTLPMCRRACRGPVHTLSLTLRLISVRNVNDLTN